MAFNVRVYGLLIDSERGILLSREFIKGKEYIKFPGGGLELGEGTRDGLRREFKEELDLEIEVGEHFYTTDFFQESAFKPDDQIISIYYFVRALGNMKDSYSHVNPQTVLAENTPHADWEEFTFTPLDEFSSDTVNLPIDKVVAQMIVDQRSEIE